MNNKSYDYANLPFKESQIICLEHQSSSLYGEVIQIILERNMCWFRPICMTISHDEYDQKLENIDLIQLRSGSDLLWPISLFRPAIDTEVISLIASLDEHQKENKNQASCRQYLNRFVQQVWLANQDKF